MSWLASLTLYLIHAIYALATFATSWRECHFAQEPRPLVAERNKKPRHVAVLLASDISDSFEQEILENMEEVVGWCRKVGIPRLTFYDREGVLSRLSFDLRARLTETESNKTACTSESELEYPLTPPLSDASSSSSRPLSPNFNYLPKLQVATLKLGESAFKRRSNGRGAVKRRVSRKNSDTTNSSFTIHVISRESGKTALAEVANSLARQHSRNSLQTKPEDFRLSINELSSLVEGENGFPSPDLMLIHHVTPCKQPKNVSELFGFPPWQISLTELHYSIYPSSWWTRSLFEPRRTDTYIPLRESDICRALDQYAGAEQRLGK
ncbi:hypothetical protein BC835DRAFT_1347882 [Cytidiella melzeri]|nr:hypothetical protein BC835DRAFT_1347882 [Cytidiella melzeri]